MGACAARQQVLKEWPRVEIDETFRSANEADGEGGDRSPLGSRNDTQQSTLSTHSDRCAGPAEAFLRSCLLVAQLARAANQTCADCGAALARPSETWIDVFFHVFLCTECSGVHRTLGASVSRVRSIMLDDWSAAAVAEQARHSNASVNAVLEFHVPRGFYKPAACAPVSARSKYIRAKYLDRAFTREAAPDAAPQPAVVNPPAEADGVLLAPGATGEHLGSGIKSRPSSPRGTAPWSSWPSVEVLSVKATGLDLGEAGSTEDKETQGLTTPDAPGTVPDADDVPNIKIRVFLSNAQRTTLVESAVLNAAQRSAFWDVAQSGVTPLKIPVASALEDIVFAVFLVGSDGSLRLHKGGKLAIAAAFGGHSEAVSIEAPMSVSVSNGSRASDAVRGRLILSVRRCEASSLERDSKAPL